MAMLITKNWKSIRIVIISVCVLEIYSLGFGQNRKAFFVGGLATLEELDLETFQIVRTFDFADTVSGASVGAIVDPQNRKLYMYSFVTDTQKYASLVRLDLDSLRIERKLFLPEYADSNWQGFIDGYLVNQGNRLFLVFYRATSTNFWYEGWTVMTAHLQKLGAVDLGYINELAYDEASSRLYFVDYLKDSKPLFRIDVNTDPTRKEILTESLSVTYDRESMVTIFVNGNELWYASDYLYRINLEDYTAEKIFKASVNTPVKAFTSDRCKLVVNKVIKDLNEDVDSPISRDSLTVIDFGHLVPNIERYIKIPAVVDTSSYGLARVNISPEGDFLVLIYYDKLKGRAPEDVVILDFRTEKLLFHQLLAPVVRVHYNYTGPLGPCPEVK